MQYYVRKVEKEHRAIVWLNGVCGMLGFRIPSARWADFSEAISELPPAQEG